MNHIDHGLIPDLDFMPVFVSLEIATEAALAPLTQTAARAEGAMRFVWFACGSADSMRCREDKASRMREAFLRAALAEFVGMESALARDLAARGRSEALLRIVDVPSPLLHVIRELRNLELHLTSHALLPNQRDAVLVFEGEEHPKVHTIYTVDGFTEESFHQLANAKRYSSEDIQFMVRWFNSAQQSWGAPDLVRRAVEEYAMHIVQMYHLVPIAPGDTEN
jgi:hypothetical protein